MLSVFRQFESGSSQRSKGVSQCTLDMLIRPVNGRLSSNIKKIPHAADKANRTRQVKTVTLGGENRLKLANMIMSQNASTARNGIGTRFSDSTNSRNRTCARPLGARDASQACAGVDAGRACSIQAIEALCRLWTQGSTGIEPGTLSHL
jgi:hypothetical protein